MEHKECIKCGKVKPVESFFIRYDYNPPKIKNTCKDCCRKNNQKYRNANKEKHNANCRIRDRRCRKRYQQYILNYLEGKACVDCGITNKVVLEFDHLYDKKFNITIGYKYKRATLEKEIAKCEIRCSNCHAIKTARDFGYYRYLAETAD